MEVTRRRRGRETERRQARAAESTCIPSHSWSNTEGETRRRRWSGEDEGGVKRGSYSEFILLSLLSSLFRTWKALPFYYFNVRFTVGCVGGEQISCHPPRRRGKGRTTRDHRASAIVNKSTRAKSLCPARSPSNRHLRKERAGSSPMDRYYDLTTIIRCFKDMQMSYVLELRKNNVGNRCSGPFSLSWNVNTLTGAVHSCQHLQRDDVFSYLFSNDIGNYPKEFTSLVCLVWEGVTAQRRETTCFPQ